MKRLLIVLGALMAAVLMAAISAGPGRGASAQASVPDLSQFGYPNVIGTVLYSPGTAATITAGNQQVVLPSDFISKTVKFELLQGDPASFKASLSITDQGRTILVAWAFRVTDVASNQLVGRFDKPVQWSITDPAIAAGSAVYNTSPANPPVVTANSAPGTLSGTTLSHPFGGAGVGWLVLGPAGAPATSTEVPATAVPATEVPIAPTEVVPVPVGMPSTGSPQSGPDIAWLAMIGLAGAALGAVLRRRRVS